MSVLSQFDAGCGHSAAAVFNIGIVLSGRINIRVSQHICHQIDIPCFLIEVCTKGASQFVGGDFFQCNAIGIFFYHILHRSHANAFALAGKEEGRFIVLFRQRIFPFFQIFFQSLTDFIAVVQEYFVAAFSCDFYGIILEIQIFDTGPGAWYTGLDWRRSYETSLSVLL